MKLKAYKVIIENKGDGINYSDFEVIIEGFSNKEVVNQIGRQEVLAELEVSDILKHFDLSDLLDGVVDMQHIKDYLKTNGETSLD